MNNNVIITTQNKGLTGTGIKIIAMVSMFIDHFGTIFLNGYLRTNYVGYENGARGGIGAVAELSDAFNNNSDAFLVLLVIFLMRLVGRLAFPLFAFLLIEGFEHTRSVKKYAINLFIFALISQLPRNLENGRLIYFGKLNVMFTLLLGLLCIWAIRQFAENKEFYFRFIITAVLIVVCGAVAYFAKFEYGIFGQGAIIAMYLLRRQRTMSMVISVLILMILDLTETFAFLIIPIINAYNGQRGMKINKYFFYAFYPVHILLIYILTLLCGYISFSIV